MVELGLIKRGATTTNCLLVYGFNALASDVAVGEEAWSANKASWIEFSETLSGGSAVVTRVTQGPVETLLTETTVAGRVSQSPVEVLILSPGDPLSMTQLVVERLNPAVYASKVSQVVAELMRMTVVETRTTQIVAEILNAQSTPTRVSQLVIEMLSKTSTYCGSPSLSPAALCGKPDVLAWLEWTVPMKGN